MKAISIISFLSLFSLLLTVETCYGQNCSPVIAVSSNNQAIDRLMVFKADTVDIRVNCLTKCPVSAESKNIKITRIGKGRFVFEPKEAGSHEVNVFTLCPKGTTITMSGFKMNASGKFPIGSWWVEALEGE